MVNYLKPRADLIIPFNVSRRIQAHLCSPLLKLLGPTIAFFVSLAPSEAVTNLLRDLAYYACSPGKV